MQKRERRREIAETQKTRDLDRKMAMKDEKMNRQGGLLENEFQEKK